MPTLAELRSRIPDLDGLDDQSAVSFIQQVYYPSVDPSVIASKLGVREAAKPKDDSDFLRGGKEAFQQIPQLAYGVGAGIATASESAFGEGGLWTGAKKAAVEGYNRWGDKIAAGAKESDSWSYSYDQAKEGNFGALVDWLQHGIGYAGGQAVQMLATAGIGAIGGKFVLGKAAEQIASGMAAKEAAEIGASEVGKKLAKDELQSLAVRNVASKIGQTTAIGASAMGMEGGEIFGDLAKRSVEEGRSLDGAELGKAFAATLAAGGLEFVGDKIGLDILVGKSKLLKPAEGILGLKGRAARGAIAGTLAAPIEGGTEYLQTGLENYGKGEEAAAVPWMQSEKAQRDALDAAALGAVGGASVGGVGGMIRGPVQKAKQDPVPAILKADTLDEALVAAQQAVANPDGMLKGLDLPATASKPLATIDEIRRLDPLDQSEALGLMSTANNPSSPDHVRRFSQNRLDELLGPIRQIPTPDVQEFEPIPVPEATELQSRQEAEVVARRTLDGWMKSAEPMTLDRAMAAASRMDGSQVVPHSGGGFTVVPGAWLPTGMADRLMAEAWPDGRIPSGEAAETIPAGESVEIPKKIPVGAATEIEPEVVEPKAILPTDLKTQDGFPYGSRVAAQIRAKKDGGQVVEVPGGFVVRKQEQTSANDIGRDGGSQPVVGERGDGTGGLLEQRPSDVQPSPAVAAGQGDTGAGVAELPRVRGTADEALTAVRSEMQPKLQSISEPISERQNDTHPVGSTFTLNGTQWTVTKATDTVIGATDGKTNKLISKSSATWKKITAEATPAAAVAQPGASNGQELQGQGRQGPLNDQATAPEEAPAVSPAPSPDAPGAVAPYAPTLKESAQAAKKRKAAHAAAQSATAQASDQQVQAPGRREPGSATLKRADTDPAKRTRQQELIDRLNKYETDLWRRVQDGQSEDSAHNSALGMAGLTEDGLLQARAWAGLYPTMKPGIVVEYDGPLQDATGRRVDAAATATHKDPGEPTEPVTPAVVAEAASPEELAPTPPTEDTKQPMAEADPFAQYDGKDLAIPLQTTEGVVTMKPDAGEYLRAKQKRIDALQALRTCLGG